MSLIKQFRENPTKTWKWAAIITICLLFLQTCSKCSHNQSAAFVEKNHIDIIDSLKISNQRLQDSILILNGNLQSLQRSNNEMMQENGYLKDALVRSQNKPVIIYKEMK